MIYIVDDAADYRFLVQQVFNRFLEKYPMRLFSDGIDLIRHIETAPPEAEQPSVIVLDVDMPGLNGLQTLERLKQKPGWRAVPVVMMTNRDSEEFSRESYRLGASSFLLKPIDLLELKDILSRLCLEWEQS